MCWHQGGFTSEPGCRKSNRRLFGTFHNRPAATHRETFLLERDNAETDIGLHGEPTHAGEALRARGTAWLHGLTGALAIVTIYSLAHVVARILASRNLGEDDPLDVLLTQTLQWGYSVHQPPLYDWLLWALQRFTGPEIEAFLILKYGLLIATAGFLYAAAVRVMRDPLWALLTVDALALIYQISWRFHEGFTHNVGAMCAAAASLWAVMRLAEKPNRAHYALLGVVMGLGLLTRHVYVVVVFALFLAALIQPSLRGIMWARPGLLTVLIALLTWMPFGVWMLFGPWAGDVVLTGPTADAAVGNGVDIVRALRDAAVGPLLFLSPYLFIPPIVFPRMIPVLWQRLQSDTTQKLRSNPPSIGAIDWERYILHVSAIVFVLMLMGAPVLGIRDYAEHRLIPLFIVFPIWLTAQARRGCSDPVQIRRFVMLTLVITLFAFGARVANMFVLDPVCKKCRWGIPYAALAENIGKAGFRPSDIVVADDELGGNLRRFLPNARIHLSGSKRFVGIVSERTRGRQLVMVWATNKAAPDVSYLRVSAHNPSAQYLAGRVHRVTIPWRHIWKTTGYRSSRWSFTEIQLPANH